MKSARNILLITLTWTISSSVWAQQPIRIDTVGTGADTRSQVAIPDFVAASGLESAAKEMTEVVANDLQFSGLFLILPHDKFPASFKGFTSDPTQIDFESWRATKVDFIIYAYVTQQGNSIVAECRMFDVRTGTQTVGQRLTTRSDLPRLVGHKFSDEIVRVIDGTPGIATSQICFSAASSSGNKEIFVADYDGHNARQVTQHSSISIKPKFSPDGSKIVYLSYKDRYPFLYVLDLSTGRSTPVSKNVGLNAAPSWSPDGRSLAMTLSKDGNTEIYIKNADGTGGRRITDSRGEDTSACFDPSGKQIAFVSDRAGQPQIHVMNVDGSNVRRVSFQGGKAYDPVWSPDGKMIAYVAEQPGEGLEIYVMNAAGGGALRLTDSAGANESPSWSADSRHVIFASTRSGRAELWAVNVQPPYDQHRISIGSARYEGPYWGPRRQ